MSTPFCASCAPNVCLLCLERHRRHTSAVHLVAAKVDPAIIRSWLGHASLDTTNLYAQANLETKRKAIEQVDGARPAKPPRWKRDADLLAWRIRCRQGACGIVVHKANSSEL